MRLGGKRGDFLAGIGDADGAAHSAAPGCGRKSRRHSPAGGRARRRPAAAPAASRGRRAANVQRLVNAEGAGRQHLAIGNAMKFQRLRLSPPRAERRCGSPAPPAAPAAAPDRLRPARHDSRRRSCPAQRQRLGMARDLARNPACAQAPCASRAARRRSDLSCDVIDPR